METTTIFLAQLWGPVILAVGIGIFVHRSFYTRVYRDLERYPLAVLLLGMIAMTAGIAQVQVHNVWGSLPQVVVSALGWGAMLKGALFILAPRFVDQMGDLWVRLKFLPLAGSFCLLVGAYLTWFAYLA